MTQVLSEKSNRHVLSASTLKGDDVVNRSGEDLGKIEDLMIDLDRGRVAYAVLSFGGFLGVGDKLFAIPWQALTIDTAEKRFILNISKELLDGHLDSTRVTGQTWRTLPGVWRFTTITATNRIGTEPAQC